MVTMSEVAKLAGVSRATASYALSGDDRIAPDTAQKVFEAARALKYTANLSARSLRSGRNGVIGVAIFELDHPYPSEMAAAVSHEASLHGIEAIVQETSNRKENEVAILRKVTSQLCDGTIFSPGKVSDAEIQTLSGGKPIVLLDMQSSRTMFDSVDTACVEGAKAAMNHLFDVGCTQPLIVGCSPRSLDDLRSLDDPQSLHTVGGRRLGGCLEACAQHGFTLTADRLHDTAWNSGDARRLAHRIADEHIPFDGAFCMTDTIAIGFIRGLADRGIRVPDDVVIAGFDGIAESEFLIPSLTTVGVDFHDLAHKAVGLLLERIDEYANGTEPKPPRRLTADYKLVVRESTTRA